MTKSSDDKDLGQLQFLYIAGNWKPFWHYLKTVTMYTCPDPAILFLVYLSPSETSICAPRNMFKNVHSSSIYNSPKLETTKCPLIIK